MSKSTKLIGELSEKNKGRLRRLIRKSKDGKSPECYYVEDWSQNPRMRVGGVIHILPRVVYFMQTGEQPAGKFLNHTCHNKWCVRKEHVFLSDHPESEGKPRKPREDGGRKLNQDLVDQIRALNKAGWTDETLARSYRVSRTTINRVINFELWPLRARKTRGPNKPRAVKPVQVPDEVGGMDEGIQKEIYEAHLKGELAASLAARFQVGTLAVYRAIGRCAFQRG